MRTSHQWRSSIEGVVFAAPDDVSDASGRSRYDYLAEQLRQMDNGSAEWQRAQRALIDVLAVQRETDLSSWLASIGLLEELAPLSRAALEELVALVEMRKTPSSEFSAYLLRVLAAKDAPIDWVRLKSLGIERELAHDAPLLWADTLVFAGMVDEATAALRPLVESKAVSIAAVLELVGRWCYRVPERNIETMFGTLRSTASGPDRGAFDQWAEAAGHKNWIQAQVRATTPLMTRDARDIAERAFV